MERSAVAHRNSLTRTVALLAVLVLALFVSSSLAPQVRARYRENSGELFRRAGDTWVLLSYLVSQPWADTFLLQAVEQYQMSGDADPANLRTTFSRGLTLQALHRTEQAREVFRAALKRAGQERTRSQLRLLLVGPLAEHPDVAQLRAAEAVVGDLPPAALVLSEAYARAGLQQERQRTWEAGEARALALRVPGLAVLIVCGLIVAAGAVGLLALLLFRVTPRRALPNRSAPSQDWRARDALEALLLFLVLQLLFGALLALIPVRTEALLYPALASSVLGGLGAIAWVKYFAGRPTLLGWRLTYSGRQLLVGVATGGAMVLPALALARVAESLFHLPPQEQPLVPIFAAATDLPARLFLILGTCAIIPALEETIFRGLLYGALRRYAPPALAMVISALIFAGGHLTASAFLSLALVGLVLAWLYEQTGSLLAPTVAHGVFNGFSIALMLLTYR